VIPRIIESGVSTDGGQNEAPAPDTPPASKRAMSWLATTIIFVNVGFALVLVVGIQRFGSAASALAWLRGDSLVPDAYSKSFGTVAKDERPSVEFLLRNWTKQPIKVIGSAGSCTCVATSDLPIVVSPHGESILRVSSRARSGSGPYSERLHVFTDPGQPSLVLRVQGVFR
jgi:Protein of unknown function (DUF1573)